MPQSTPGGKPRPGSTDDEAARAHAEKMAALGAQARFPSTSGRPIARLRSDSTLRVPDAAPPPPLSNPRPSASATHAPFRARRLLVYRDSLGTGSGTPRDNGRVDVEWLGEHDQRRKVKMSRKQFEEFRRLAGESGALLFRPTAGTDVARDAARTRARRFVKRCQEFGLPVEDTRGSDGHRVALRGPFDVREIAGPSDVAVEAKRLLREAQGDALRGRASN